MASKMTARFQKFQLFAHLSSEMTHFDALSLVLGQKLGVEKPTQNFLVHFSKIGQKICYIHVKTCASSFLLISNI